MSNLYQQTQAFHEQFDPPKNNRPTALSAEEASFRAGFKAEELVEFLHAAAANEPAVFAELVSELKASIDVAATKVLAKNKPAGDPLVDEVDALVDMLYFTYGTFVLMGVDPTELVTIVHEANMGKLFADGKPHYHPVTGKVLKPTNWERDYAPEVRLKQALLEQASQSSAE